MSMTDVIPSNSTTYNTDDTRLSPSTTSIPIPSEEENYSESTTLLSNAPFSFGFRDIPFAVYLVILVELMERFSFYGLVSMLVLFLRDELKFTESSAKSIFSLFTALCYFAPLLGSFLGDAVLGRYWTISGAAFIYVIGVVLLVYTTWQKYRATAYISLFCIALGTGCLKANIASFGARSLGTQEPIAVAKYFSLFYFSINVGGLASTLILPIIEKHANYTITYTIPAVCLFLALILFMSGKSWYTHEPPSESLYVRLIKIVCASRKEKSFVLKQRLHVTPALRHTRRRKYVENTPNTFTQESPYIEIQTIKSHHEHLSNKDESNQNNIHTVDHAFDANSAYFDGPSSPTSSSTTTPSIATYNLDSDDLNDLTYQPHWLDYAKLRYRPEHVEEVKRVFNIFPLFFFFIIFWLCFDQQYSTFVLQAEKMDRKIFGGHFEILSTQITALNSIFILIFVPLFDSFLYPLLRKCGFKLKHLNRMLFGMILTVLAFLCCAFVDYQIATKPADSVTIWFQLPQYIIITAAEILISMTGLEFIYSLAPVQFKSTLSSFWGLTIAIGDVFAAILFSFNIQSWKFSLLCAGLMLLDFFAFFPVTIWFNKTIEHMYTSSIELLSPDSVDGFRYGTSDDDDINTTIAALSSPQPDSLASSSKIKTNSNASGLSPNNLDEYQQYDPNTTPFEEISPEQRNVLLYGSAQPTID